MERKYIIPLRKEWQKVPIYSRSRKATKATRLFLQKHMKVEIVKLGKYLNLKLWERGNRNPPHKIEVIATKIEDKDKGTYVYAEIPGAPVEEKKEVKKKAKGLAEKLKAKISGDKPKDLDKKPIAEMSKEEVAKEEGRLQQKEAKNAPKAKAPIKKPVATLKKESIKTMKENTVKRDNKK